MDGPIGGDAMLVMLGFGSSARRGATGWTDRGRFRAALDACQPDLAVDGKSPAGGADDAFHAAAREHFVSLGLDPDARTARCPVDHALDGPWPAAGPRRNERQYRTHRPTLAIGGITGKVGSPLSSGSKGMVRICLAGLRGDDPRVVLVPPCPVVVYRDDGVEPYTDLATALRQLRRLYAVTKDPALVIPGQALKSLCEIGDPTPAEVLEALGYARDGSRWAPWLDAMIATVALAT